jgi:hypothetical protein
MLCEGRAAATSALESVSGGCGVNGSSRRRDLGEVFKWTTNAVHRYLETEETSIRPGILGEEQLFIEDFHFDLDG